MLDNKNLEFEIIGCVPEALNSSILNLWAYGLGLRLRAGEKHTIKLCKGTQFRPLVSFGFFSTNLGASTFRKEGSSIYSISTGIIETLRSFEWAKTLMTGL